MKITNRYGLPGAIVEAIKNDSYDCGESDITVTQLIKPPQMVLLQKRHANEIEEDASQMLWALMGSAMHHILERAEPSAIVEKRVYVNHNGFRVSGQLDRITLRGTTLQDYKFASVWEYIHGLKVEREQQINLLVTLLEENGHSVRRGETVLLFRDFQLSKAETDQSYPQQQIARVPVDIWPKEQRDAFLSSRILLHVKAQLEGEYPRCTNEERWVRGECWAVVKVGRKTAVRVFNEKQAAENYLISVADKSLSTEHRAGKPIRCEKYCNVNKFCNQYKEEKNAN